MHPIESLHIVLPLVLSFSFLFAFAFDFDFDVDCYCCGIPIWPPLLSSFSILHGLDLTGLELSLAFLEVQ